MAYIPKTWQTGEVITANDLNHLEDGVEELSKASTVFVEIQQVDGVWLSKKTIAELFENAIPFATFEEEGAITKVYNVVVYEGLSGGNCFSGVIHYEYSEEGIYVYDNINPLFAYFSSGNQLTGVSCKVNTTEEYDLDNYIRFEIDHFLTTVTS